jgi:DNA invertase Pin-like site-specific DNA recombinase
MARIGYARVSTRGQCDDSQLDDLNACGCDRIFTDHGISGKHAARPQLDAALEYMREGDVLVITRLSRAMRSLKHLLTLTADLQERGIGLKVLKQDIDTTTPTGRLVFHILAAIDEFQRELIVEGTREGLAAARARGRKGGNVAKLSEVQQKVLREMHEARREDGFHEFTAEEIAETLKVHRTTVYDYLRMQDDPGGENRKTHTREAVKARRERMGRMFYQQHRTVAEIAGETGWSVPTVRRELKAWKAEHPQAASGKETPRA